MNESNITELLDAIMEEMEDVVSDNVITVTTELIKRSCGTVLSDAQVEQCISLCASGDTKFFEDLLEKNGLTKAKLEKIDKYSNIISSIGDVKSLCENVLNIYLAVDSYMYSGDVTVAASALSESLRALDTALGFFVDCPFVSDILSLGADILDKGTELVKQRAELYDELDAILDSVMNGTSTNEQESQVKTMYATVKGFEESGYTEGIKLYKAILNEYNWLFTLAGVDTAKLNEYSQEMTLIQNSYNALSTQMQEVEKIDIDNDGILSDEEIELNTQQIQESEKSQQYDPLILDLNKNGKFTSDTKNGVHFDYSGDSFAEKTAWAEEGDGLLVYDKNENGTIDDGNELFGDKTIMQNGSVATNGFAALGDLDSNGDMKISSEDTLFDQLQVWIDTNNDGISQQDELFSLRELGIKELSLNSKTYNTTDENGNIIARKSSFTYEDGTSGEMAELNFDIASSDTVSKNEIEVSDEIKNGYPQLIPSGNMLNLHEAMSVDEELYKLVKDFVNTEDMVGLEKLVTQIIVRWTQTEDVVAGSRGSYVDATQLAIIEKFYGKDFVGLNGQNPNNTAGPILTEVYNELYRDIFSKLLGQTILKDYCAATVVKENFISGEKRIDYTYVIAMFEDEFAGNEVNTLAKMKYYLQLLACDDETSGLYSAATFKEAVAGSIYATCFDKVSNISIIDGTDVDNVITGDSANNLLLGREGNDAINGENGNDIIHGGAGNDSLTGGSGADTYVFNLGDGTDVINNYDSGNWKNDKIVFGEGIAPEDIELTRTGYDLIISNVKSGDKITVQNAYKDGDGWYFIGSIEFTDGTAWGLEELKANRKYMRGTEGADTLAGFDSGYNNNPNEIFETGAGNDTVTAGVGNDTIYGGSGNDVIYGGDGSDTLYGESGNDYVRGGTGVDTYVFNLGDGQDVIYNYNSEWKSDKIVFGEGIAPEDIELTREVDNLIISNVKSEDKITVENAYRDKYGWYFIGSIEFSDGTAWGLEELKANRKYMRGTEGSDTLTGFDSGYNNNTNEIFDGGAGNDVLKGSSGNDTYIFYTGCGNDTIYDYSGTNKIEFTDTIRPEDITVSRSGSYNVVLTIADCEDSITIQNFMYSSSYRNFTLSFADGRTATFDVTNLCLIYEPAEEPVADLDALAQENAQSLADIMSEGDVANDNMVAATEADLSLIMSDDASVDASTDTQAGLLAQELSALDTENNVFTSNDVAAVEQTQLFTEQCTVE